LLEFHHDIILKLCTATVLGLTYAKSLSLWINY